MSSRNGRDKRYIRKLKTDIPRFLRNALKYKRFQAKKSGLEFDLDEEWLQKQPLMCAISGRKFEIPDKGVGPFTPSFDRIDPKKGYTKSNTQIICFWLNAAKGSWPESVLRENIVAAARVLSQ